MAVAVRWVSAIVVGIMVLLMATWAIYGRYLVDQGVYRGYVELGFENYSYRPCGGGPQWWLSGTALPELERRYQQLAGAHYQPVYVELKAAVSQPGTSVTWAFTSGKWTLPR